MKHRATLVVSVGLALCPLQAITALPATPVKTPVMPTVALNRLLAGNLRFAEGRPIHPDNHILRREALVEGQEPIAAILSCSDSRVPPDTIFDTGLGEIFAVRVAGNTVDPLGDQSLQYAVKQLHTPLIMVLGHDSCGAVTAAVEAYPKQDAGTMLKNIYPAVAAAMNETGDRVSNAINANVLGMVKELEAEPAFAEYIKKGKLRIVGARYNLATGKVELLTP
jgi:carbonic anhydrase